MSGKTGGAEGASAGKGGKERDKVAETPDSNAARGKDAARSFPRQNSSKNAKVGSGGEKVAENTANAAHSDSATSALGNRASEATPTPVRVPETPAPSRKRTLEGAQRVTPPKKVHADPVALASHMNNQPDTPFNHELRIQLEKIALKDRWTYFNALTKEKRIRTVCECAGIIALLECPGDKCQKVGSLRPNGTYPLTQTQIRKGGCKMRVFHCPRPRNNGGYPARTGCGKTVGNNNLYICFVEKRDEIKHYLETHQLLAQTCDDSDKRSHAVAKGLSNPAAKRKNSKHSSALASSSKQKSTKPEVVFTPKKKTQKRTTKVRSRGKKPTLDELYQSEKEDSYLGDSSDEDKVLQAKIDTINEILRSPTQTTIPTTGLLVKSKSAVGASTTSATEIIELDKTQKPVKATPNELPAPTTSSQTGAAAASTSNMQTIAAPPLEDAAVDPESLPAGSPPPDMVGYESSTSTALPEAGAASQGAAQTAEEERAAWTAQPDEQKYNLYTEMKLIIKQQAADVESLLKRDEQKAEEIKMMKEQLAVITQRLTGIEPVPMPEPYQPIVNTALIDAGSTFPALPPTAYRPPSRTVPLALRPGEEPNWAQIVKRGQKATVAEVGDAFKATMSEVKKKLATIRAKAARRTAKTRELREFDVLHFTGRGRIQHWQMKKLLVQAMKEQNRNMPIPLLFVSFIGGSVMEVLVDKKSSAMVIVILRELGHKYLKEGIDPLARLVRKRSSASEDSVALVNARKCKERAEVILSKFGGPEVIHHYTELLNKAEAIIAKETPEGETASANASSGGSAAIVQPENAAVGATARPEEPSAEIETTLTPAEAAAAAASAAVAATQNTSQNGSEVERQTGDDTSTGTPSGAPPAASAAAGTPPATSNEAMELVPTPAPIAEEPQAMDVDSSTHPPKAAASRILDGDDVEK